MRVAEHGETRAVRRPFGVAGAFDTVTTRHDQDDCRAGGLGGRYGQREENPYDYDRHHRNNTDNGAPAMPARGARARRAWARRRRRGCFGIRWRHGLDLRLDRAHRYRRVRLTRGPLVVLRHAVLSTRSSMP